MKTAVQAIKLFLILSIITGIVYPLAITIIAQVLFPGKANGSLLKVNGITVGSELLGQEFTGNEYFWPRPSALNYNPLPSGGTNLGPTSAVLKDSIVARRIALEKSNPGYAGVPMDLLSASGSGLDPDISPEAMLFQIDRVGKARGLDSEQKKQLILLADNSIARPQFSIFGEPRVNVVRLNLSLDSAFDRHGHE